MVEIDSWRPVLDLLKECDKGWIVELYRDRSERSDYVIIEKCSDLLREAPNVSLVQKVFVERVDHADRVIYATEDLT